MASRSSLLHLVQNIATFFCVAAFAGACLHIPPRETLRIGLTPDAPPMAFLENGELAGVEVTLGQMLSKALDREPKWVQLKWQDLIPALKANQIDLIMSGMSITEERAETVLFTTPYMKVGQTVAIRWSDLQERSDPRTMKTPRTRIGVGRDTTGERLVADRFPAAQIIPFDHTAGLVAGLRQGEVDYIVHDAPTIWHITAEPGGGDLIGLFRPLNQEFLAWAVAPQQPELKNQIDPLIQKWKQDGQLDAAFNRWIPIRVNVGH